MTFFLQRLGNDYIYVKKIYIYIQMAVIRYKLADLPVDVSGISNRNLVHPLPLQVETFCWLQIAF